VPVAAADATVVVPTIGRPSLLAETLASVARCEPRPAELIVVDQSEEVASIEVVNDLHLPGARVVQSRSRGRGRAVNEGLRHATRPITFVLDDDCAVRSDWVAVGIRAMRQVPDGIICGRVLPAGGDPRAVPSIYLAERPDDYSGELHCGVLYAGNMVCSPESVLAVGGFDERIVPAAEDCDFCYRWLRGGGRLRHVPELVVWHRDWRTPDELRKLYVDYACGRGMFYAKHLRARDLTVLRFMAGDLYAGFRGLAASLVLGRSPWADPRRGVFRGVPRGLWKGWQEFRPRP
jgi:GT2 family glycosyltransferase